MLKAVIPSVVAAIGWIVVFVKNNKEEIAAVIKRVEADAQGGWTKEEKQAYAWELFETKIYPDLPWYFKVFGKERLKKWFFAAIDRICKKAKDIK